METKSESAYGQLVIDQLSLRKEAPNVTICQEIDAERFKELLFRNIV